MAVGLRPRALAGSQAKTRWSSRASRPAWRAGLALLDETELAAVLAHERQQALAKISADEAAVLTAGGIAQLSRAPC